MDILICTPGRLMDHLSRTPNFSLQHLRFLVSFVDTFYLHSVRRIQVIDEADRLLSQSFQNWLAQVLAAIHWRPSESISSPTKLSPEYPLPPDCDSLAPACLSFDHLEYSQVDFAEQRHFSCQKLLFSATLTQDPGKLASLGLRNPKYFIVQGHADDGSDGAPSHLVSERFAMPTTLTVRTFRASLNLVRVNLCGSGTYGRLRSITETSHSDSPFPQPECAQCLGFHQIIGIHLPACLFAWLLRRAKNARAWSR